MSEVNKNLTIQPSASRTADPTQVDQRNAGCKGVQVVVDVTVNAGGLGSITVTIEGKDVVSGKYYTLLASAALTGVATTVLRVYPALTAAANLVASDFVPRTFRVKVTHNNANPITYSVGASLVR
jgi:hypothetical protein